MIPWILKCKYCILIFVLSKIKKRPWDVSVEEAYRIQEDLKKHIAIRDAVKDPSIIGGVDVSYEIGSKRACCVIAVFSYPLLRPLCHAYAIGEVTFPYIPGLFAFREGPLVEKAFLRLSIMPDLFLFDGHGICHPSGIGIASHLGVCLDISTIGCAKNHLFGTFEDPGQKRGSISPVMIEGALAGYVLRTKDNTKPVFVSPGHKIDFHTCLEICMSCSRRFRIPDPIRFAHISSRLLLKQSTTERHTGPPEMQARTSGEQARHRQKAIS